MSLSPDLLAAINLFSNPNVSVDQAAKMGGERIIEAIRSGKLAAPPAYAEVDGNTVFFPGSVLVTERAAIMPFLKEVEL